MLKLKVITERCLVTGLLVAHIPGIAGAHTQAETLDELARNMKEILKMLCAITE